MAEADPTLDALRHDAATAQEKQAIGASGAAAGAIIGTMIFPGVGTAIGAAVGGLASLFAGNRKLKPKVNPGLPIVPGASLAELNAPPQQLDAGVAWLQKLATAAASSTSLQNQQLRAFNAVAGADQAATVQRAENRQLALYAAAAVAALAILKRKGQL